MQYIQGTPRQQIPIWNETFDDRIEENHPIRFIDKYVDSLDLEKLEIKSGMATTGRPPYAPGLLLKIFIYAYLNRLRSSRKIANELTRNIELIWLAEALRPDFRTISDFRKNNSGALKKLYKEFLRFCATLELVDFKEVGIDGTKMRAQNNNGNIFRRDTVEEVIGKIDEKIEEYMKELEENDKREENAIALDVEKVAKHLETLKRQRLKAVDAKEEFATIPGKDTVFATDEDARMMSDKGKIRPGYNVQTVVDGKSKLIVAAEVTNESNDQHQMTTMLNVVSETKKELGIKTETTALMDAGYAVEDEILANKDSEEFNIVAPSPKDSMKDQKPESIPKKEYRAEQFTYDATNDEYHCPEGKVLVRITPVGGVLVNGKMMSTYRCAGCETCEKGNLCTRSDAGRTVSRSEHHEEMEAFRSMMKTPEYKAKVNKRKELCEHPFGTLKRGLGYDHFLLKGFEKVRGEFSLMCFIYNFKRTLSLIGVIGLIAALQT